MKFHYRALPRIFVVKLCLLLFSSCVSEQDTCEIANRPDIWAQNCLLTLTMADECYDRLALGAATPDECAESDRNAAFACTMYYSKQRKCQKKSNLPVFPKIVWSQWKQTTG